MFTKLKQLSGSRRKTDTFFGLRSVLTLLLLIIGACASWGQTTYYYVFKNSSNYYMRNPNPGSTGTPQGSTTFDANCVWVASGTLGTTGRNISSEPATDYEYLSYSVSGNVPYNLAINRTSKNWKINEDGYLYADAKKTHYVVGTSGNLAFGGEGSTTDAFKAIQVTIETVPKSLSLRNVVLDQYINTTGAHANSATGHYVSGGTDYYFQNEHHYLELEEGDDVTITYSLQSNDYATVNASTGAITVNSLPTSGQVTLNLTITASKSGYNDYSRTYPIYLIPANGIHFQSNREYAITYQDSKYLGGDAPTDLTAFDPANSIWSSVIVNGSNTGKLQNNGGYYLNGSFSNGTLSMSNNEASATSWTIDGDATSNGENVAKKISVTQSGTTRYVYYNSGWTFPASTPPAQTGAYYVTTHKYLAADQNPSIEGDAMIYSTGINTSMHRTADAVHQEDFYDFEFFKSNAQDAFHHHYFTKSGDNYTATTNRAASYTYTWSMTCATGHTTVDISQYATINSETGAITYSEYVTDNDVWATVTLTATPAAPFGEHVKTATMDVHFGIPDNPTDISVTSADIEVMVGADMELPYMLTPYTVYNNVYATIADGTRISISGPERTGNTGTFTVHGLVAGTTTVKLTARKLDLSDGPSVTVNVVVKDQCAAPVIEFIDNGTTATTNITCATAGASIYYTTDGSEPSPTHGTLYDPSNPFSVVNNTTVKAIAVCEGYFPSVITTSTYLHNTGIYGDIVMLYDCEDHNWTVYQPTINGETNPIYLPNPKDVKISYLGNGGEVGIDAPQNKYIYFKTLTQENGAYHYTLIPNPFSKRPKNGDNYQGFSKWKIKSITGGTISGYSVGSEINAETQLTFVPGSEYGMEVEFEAVWTTAYVVRCTAANVNANLDSGTLEGNSYETNFIVVTSGTSTTALTATSKKVTITMVEPDGSRDYRTNPASGTTPYINPQTITLSNDWKFEYININNNNTTITANNHDLVLGRGIANSNGGNALSANYVRGMGTTESNSLNYHIRIESGIYAYLSFTNGTEQSTATTTFGGLNFVRGTVGCDYDRADEEHTLSRLKVTTGCYLGYSDGSNVSLFTNTNNINRKTFDVTIKSGDILSDKTSAIADAAECFYFSIGGGQTNVGRRYLTIEGGQLLSIAGGIDEKNIVSDTTFTLRITGGKIRGSIYGGAAFAATNGHRKYIFTGGEINGWVAAGANGVETTQTGENLGVLPSNSYMYIGGKCRIDNENDAPINVARSGDVFGAGNGGTYNSGRPNAGQVENSNLIIADEAFVKNDVYGGGNQGHTKKDARVWITGGTVGGRVFGGSNMNSGANTYITMTGGQVNGGIYGGSNTQGTISSNTDIKVYGGQVGTSEQSANIHGGGLGQPTQVTGDVDITLGDNNGHYPTVYGDVYGGSALGRVNGTTANSSRHTIVTVNDAQINGNVYGGGLGNSTVAADVYGLVTVNFKGGSADNVFGCNNVNGAPQCSPVTVNVDGGNIIHNIYGGANQASYTGNTIVNVGQAGNAELQVNDVFGAGKGVSSEVTGTTNVTLFNGMVKGSIYGGAEEGSVRKNATDCTLKSAYVTVKGGTVKHSVYGGGKLGAMVGQTIVSIEGGRIETNVFGGAQGGDGCGVLVAGLKTVNMKAGTIIGDIYGGSENAIDASVKPNSQDLEAQYTQLDALTDAQDRQSTIFINMYGGRVYQNIYGGGFMGKIYGSTTVNIGKNAIDNAPDRTANVNKPTGTYAIVAPVHVSGSLYAGSDWGTFSAGSAFDDPNITGYSNIYVDGLGYDMQKNLTENYMIVYGSIFGCGTSSEAGMQGRRVFVRNYGLPIGDGDNLTGCTRSLLSIQRADSVYIENSFIKFVGQGDISSPVTTQSYAMNNIFEELRLTGASTIYIDRPIDNLKRLKSMELASGKTIYDADPTEDYTVVNYNDLASCANRFSVNEGSYINVKYPAKWVGDLAHNNLFGELSGYFYMCSSATSIFAYARPKNAVSSPCPSTYTNDNDGGFVSYLPAKNTYSADGTYDGSGGQVQIPFTNQVPASKNDVEYFRYWQFKDASTTSNYRELVIVAQSNGNDGVEYQVKGGTVVLPAAKSIDSYYKIRYIDWGLDVACVDAAINMDNNDLDQWSFYHDGNIYKSQPQDAEGIPEQLAYINERPNIVFGLAVTADGCLVRGYHLVGDEDPQPDAKNALIFSNNTQAEYIPHCRFVVDPNNLLKTPELHFMLTYSNQIDKNDILSPVRVVLDEYNNGVVVSTTDIDLFVNTMTNIKENFGVPGYAVMCGMGDNGDTYTSKVSMPTFSLYGDFKESEVSLKSITANLSLDGTPATLHPVEWFETTAGTETDVAVMFGPSMTFDNIQGWLTGYIPEDPEASLKDVATMAPNTVLGTVDGRQKFGFDVKLIYNGAVDIHRVSQVLGTITFTMQVTNHEATPTEFVMTYEIIERGLPLNNYVDGVDGNNFYQGNYSNQSVRSVSGIFNSGSYSPIDNIFIVNTVTINDARGTEWDGSIYDYTPTVYRYPGGHQIVDNTSGLPIEYVEGMTPPAGPAPCDDPLIVANKNLTMRNMIIDGMSEYDETYDPNLNNDYYHTQGTGNHGLSTKAESPLVVVNDGAEVALYGTAIQNNYNNNDGNPGGTSGIMVNGNGTLSLYDGTTVTGNQNGAGITLEGNMNVSGVVNVANNTDENGRPKNVSIIPDVEGGTPTYIAIDAENGGLDPTSRIGVTKSIPDFEEYTPIAYCKDVDMIVEAFENGCFFDDKGLYAIVYDPDNLDPHMIYFAQTWVSAITDKPDGFDADNIDSREELAWAVSIVNGFNGCIDEEHNPDLDIKITSDLDMTQHIWYPMGTEDSPYTGNFDGGGNEIVIRTESLTGLDAVGLFGYVDEGAEVSNVYAYGEVSSPDCDYMGSIAGVVSGGAQVHDCIGSLKLTTSKTYTIMGALVGRLNNASLTSCITQADMNGYLMGGLVGQNYNGASVKNCYTNPKFNYLGTEAQPDSEEHYIAGLVADQQGTVENSYIYVKATDIDIPADKTFYVFTDHVDGGSVSKCYYSWNLDGTYPLYHGTNPTSNCDKYFEATIPYKYNENSNRISNGAYLLKTLNGNAGSTMTNWFRIASPVNQDLPLLCLPESASVAEIDGLLHYNASLQETMGLYHDHNYTAISVYASSEVETTSSNTGEDYKIYIGENAAVLQGDGCTLKAFVGITLDNSAGANGVDPSAGGEDKIDWHMFSTSLSDAPLGINYVDGSGNPDYGVHDWWHGHFQGNYPFFEDNDLAGISGYFPDDTPLSNQSSLSGYDFYCYYEPHFHWINFKRNGNSHWHEDAIDNVHEWIPYSYTDNAGTVHTASSETGSTFTNESQLIRGKGYLASVNDETYLQAYGTLNNGDVEYKDVAYTSGAKCPGLNLLGNPYQSFLDFDKFAYENNINSYTILDEEKGGYVSYTSGSSANDLTADKFIHMHQGFFVVVNAAGSATFTNDMRNATTDEASFRGEERPAYPVINLILSETSGNKSYAVVELDRPGVGGAKKVSTLRSGDAQIYVHYDNEDYSLVFTQPGISSLPVRFDTDREGTFTLSWNTLNATFSYLHLIDNQTGMDIDCLENDEYVFNATPADYESRFKLVFAYTGVEENEIELPDNFAFFNGDELIVNGEGHFECVDLQGRRLFVTDVYGAQNHVKLPDYASGLYLLHLSNGKQSKVQKIVIK